ncbi:MAG: cation:proton antiporter [Oscillospiraceae bacterium]
MQTYEFILQIALILLTTKVFGILTKKIDMPQVVGALLAGLIFGPAMLGILTETVFINQLAELGVIVLLFTAGLQTDISELKKTGKAATIIAIGGVVLSIAGGFAVSAIFNTNPHATMQNVFIGVILASTSVSISVEALREMGKLNTKAGNAILGAALIDDLIGIVCLTVITGMASPNVKMGVVIGKIVLFFVLSLILGLVLNKVFEKWMNMYDRDKKRFAILMFAFCLVFAYGAQELFGVADITGAFIAGLILSNTTRVTYITSRCEVLSYMFLSPIFFASIGIKVAIPHMSTSIILFSVLLLVVALIAKLIGCGIGAKISKFSNADSLRVGVGMMTRGEVSLIVATQGLALGLMNPDFFGPVVVVVVITPIITPILIKKVFKDKQEDTTQSSLVTQYHESKDFDRAAQELLELHDEMSTEWQSSWR